MHVQLVAHCHLYSRLLCYHLSSLFLHPPSQVTVEAVVFFCPSDTRTVAVLEWFARHAAATAATSSKTVKLRPWPLDQRSLCRRAIGRNLAFKASTADWVWGIDVDYLLGPGCLDAIPAAVEGVSGPLCFPRLTARTATQETGDELIERVTEPGLYDVPTVAAGDPAAGLWEIERNQRAIGGIQIVRGDVARSRGYLPNSRRFQRPVDSWRRTFEDRHFRADIGAGRGEAIYLPQLRRIRHSRRGRFDVGVQL